MLGLDLLIRLKLLGDAGPINAPDYAALDGYDLVIVPDGVVPDFDPATEQTGEVETASVPFTPGPAGTKWVAAIRTRRATGFASEAATVLLPLVSDGTSLHARPNEPALLSVSPLLGGDVEVRWEHSDVDAAASAASFKLFGDGGSGAVDWGTPLATVDAAARRTTLSGLTPGVRHLIGAEAFSAAGKGDGNRAAMMVVPRDEASPGLLELTAVQVD